MDNYAKLMREVEQVDADATPTAWAYRISYALIQCALAEGLTKEQIQNLLITMAAYMPLELTVYAANHHVKMVKAYEDAGVNPDGSIDIPDFIPDMFKEDNNG